MNRYKIKTYYINKENVKIVKNHLYEVKNTDIDDIFIIYLNEKLYNRYQKLSKIIKVDLLTKLDNLLSHRIRTSQYLETTLSYELTKSIDNYIIEKLSKLK